MFGELQYPEGQYPEVQESGGPNSPARFADQLQGILGDDSELDPVFLEESWTLGVQAAVHRRQERRQTQAARERQAHEFRELNSLGTLTFVDAGEWLGGIYQLAAQMASARETIVSRLAEPSSAAGENPGSARLTPQQNACHLLGVTAASTREQLRAAYRRMVVAWHPDRVERGDETRRRQATERMAAINEAYRLLCSNLAAEPA
jgi:DnaJ-domain-containing protein 1